MTANSPHVKRTTTLLKPDQSRVLLRPFTPGNRQRIGGIITRIMALPEEQVGPMLDEVYAEFSRRHQQINKLFRERFEEIRQLLALNVGFSDQRKLLIGSYFMAEYSLESAALFNPSIVPHPDQSGLASGALRFILSLRATGEGHISSLTFRTGILHPDNRIEILPAAGFLTEPRQTPNTQYEKALFERTLAEAGLSNDFTRQVMGRLGESFSLEDLRAAVKLVKQSRSLEESGQGPRNAAQGLWMLARSNFEVQFQPDQQLSERILFPATPAQRNGIEDARLVCFQKEDGSRVYYATFTAFDGEVVLPELVETRDFLRFRFTTLNGPAAKNKGMALFPRKIDGKFAMLSRQDNENMYLMFSDNIHFWNEHTLLLKPAVAWDLIQLGNCGSPIETDAGWLVLTHGVGPLRKYCIGAILLDRKDPSRVIGRLLEPLLKPTQTEREGYVPNVVYTCGALLHNAELIIPYGVADHATSFATVPLKQVLAAMR